MTGAEVHWRVRVRAWRRGAPARARAWFGASFAHPLIPNPASARLASLNRSRLLMRHTLQRFAAGRVGHSRSGQRLSH